MAKNGDIDDSKEHGEVGLDADDNDTKDIIRLTAKDDDQWFYVPRNHAMIANLIKTSLESDAEAREITVPGRCSRPAVVVVVVVVVVLVLPPLMWCMGGVFEMQNVYLTYVSVILQVSLRPSWGLWSST
jgi:hypothetical protein